MPCSVLLTERRRTLIVPPGPRVLGCDRGQISLYHLAHEFIECRLVVPSQLLLGLPRIAKQEVNLSGPEIAGIDLNENISCRAVETYFLDARAFPNDRPSDGGKGPFHELPHRMLLTGRKDIVIRL